MTPAGIEQATFRIWKSRVCIRPNKLEKVGYLLDNINLKNVLYLRPNKSGN